MTRIYHIGLAVPDLEMGMEQIAEIFQLTWREIQERPLVIDDGDVTRTSTLRVCYSDTTPFALEIWKSVPGTPMQAPAGGYFHHIGYWVDELEPEVERLRGLGYPPFFEGATATILRGPGGLNLEPCSLTRDRPHYRDLFPPDSPFYRAKDV